MASIADVAATYGWPLRDILSMGFRRFVAFARLTDSVYAERERQWAQMLRATIHGSAEQFTSVTEALQETIWLGWGKRPFASASPTQSRRLPMQRQRSETLPGSPKAPRELTPAEMAVQEKLSAALSKWMSDKHLARSIALVDKMPE